MKLIYESVNYSIFILSFISAFVLILILVRSRYFKTIFDPSSAILFQICFTFFILLSIGLITLFDIATYVLFFLLLLTTSKISLSNKILFTEKDFHTFSTFFLFISIINNIILIKEKGFILFYSNPELAKVAFYSGGGIYKRLNEIGTAIFGIRSIYLFYENKKKKAFFMFLYTLFLLLTLGSKSGIIAILFLIGSFAHFYKIKIINFKFFILIFITFVSVGAMFFWIYRESALINIYMRIVSFADGPFYYFNGKLDNRIAYPIDYIFDVLFTNLRIYDSLKYISLGPLINYYYFNFDNPLFGPNPQFVVEAKVIFGFFSLIYVCLIVIIFNLIRNSSSTPYSLFLLSYFFNPLFIDIQYAFANLLTLGIFFFIFVPYTVVRRILLLKISSR